MLSSEFSSLLAWSEEGSLTWIFFDILENFHTLTHSVKKSEMLITEMCKQKTSLKANQLPFSPSQKWSLIGINVLHKKVENTPAQRSLAAIFIVWLKSLVLTSAIWYHYSLLSLMFAGLNQPSWRWDFTHSLCFILEPRTRCEGTKVPLRSLRVGQPRLRREL